MYTRQEIEEALEEFVAAREGVRRATHECNMDQWRVVREEQDARSVPDLTAARGRSLAANPNLYQVELEALVRLDNAHAKLYTRLAANGTKIGDLP